MFSLKPRKDAFRLLFPKEFIPNEINKKYSEILKAHKSFYYKPIDFLNETIKSIDVLGITNGTYAQQQTTKGTPTKFANRKNENAFQGASTDVIYRSVANPLSLIDKTLNVTFRHTLGYLNYFLLMETFLYDYSRDTKGIPDLDYNFRVDIMNENGAIYSSIILDHPLIDGIDMLTFDNSQPVAQNETFKCVFKYSNFKYQFIEVDTLTSQVDLDEYLDSVKQTYPFMQGNMVQKNPNRIPSFKSSSPIDTVPGYFVYKDEWMSPSSDGQIIYEDEGGVLQDIVHHERLNSEKTYQKSENNSGGSSGGNSGNNSGGNSGGSSGGNSSNNSGGNSNDNSGGNSNNNSGNNSGENSNNNSGNNSGGNSNNNSGGNSTGNSGNNSGSNLGNNSNNNNSTNMTNKSNNSSGFNVENKEESESFISMLATAKMNNINGLNENEKFNLYPYPKDYTEGVRELSSFEITTDKDHSSTKIKPDGTKTDEYNNHSEYPIWKEEDFAKFKHT